MGLANEAGYLYVYSKELVAVNKQIQKLSHKAEKHARKHQTAISEIKKQKHKEKHTKTKIKIETLLKKHNHIILLIKHHHLAFYHALGKEHKI